MQMGGDSDKEDSPGDATAKKTGDQEGGSGKKASAGAEEIKKGLWTAAEDDILVEYVRKHGEGNWNKVPRKAGLARDGKSCRLRWVNHLRTDLKKCSFEPEEELLISRLHKQHGNQWALIASQLPGRTDDEIRNYWNKRMRRCLYDDLSICAPEECQPTMSSSAPPVGFFHGEPRFIAQRSQPLPNAIAFGEPPAPEMAAASPFAPGPYMGQLSFPFSPTTPPPTPTNLFQQQQQPPTAHIAFSNGSYDSTLPPLSASLPARMELPSSQFPYSDPLLGGTMAGGVPGGMSLQDAHGAVPKLVEEDETDWIPIGGGGADADGLYRREVFGGGIEAIFANSVLESSFRSDILGSNFHEGINVSNPAPDGLSTIPNPTAPEIPEWRDVNDAEHVPDGQWSSLVLDVDYLGPEVDQLASSLSIPTVDHDQEQQDLGSCPWNNMPGIS